MVKSFSSLRKLVIFKTLRVLICLFLLGVCSTSEVPSLYSSSATLDPITEEFLIKGKADHDQLGNPSGNDGFEDFVIEVPSTDSSQEAVYVIYGGESSSSLDHNLGLGSLDPAPTGFSIKVNANDEISGSETSIVGDINKDRYDDILIEASLKENGQEVANVVYGGERSSMSNLDLSTTMLDPATTGFRITGSISEFLANSLSLNGDILIHRKESDQGGISRSPNEDPKDDHCPINCNRCSSLFSCSECTNPYLLYESECVQSCPEGSFPVNGKCEVQLMGDSRRLQSCTSSHCVTCPDPNQCLVCASGYFLLMDPGTCYAICPTDCPLGCTECSDQTLCTLCSTGYTLTGTMCVSDCPTGCSTCSGSICTTCSSGYFLSGVQCTQTCPTRTYGDTVIRECSDCPLNCDTCSSSSSCSFCSSGYFFSGVQCTQTCPAGTYGDTALRKCSVCLTGCDSCEDSSTCTTCSSGYFLSGVQCTQTCPTGTYSDTALRKCSDCPTGCSECSDLSTCTVCESGYVFFANMCYSSCPPTTFNENSFCQDCPTSCVTCSNSSTCTTCSSGYFLSGVQCTQTCPAVTFPSASGVCEDCPLHCSSCTSEKSCKTCDEGYSLSSALCITTPSLSPSTEKAQQKATKAVSSAITGAGSVLCVGSPTFPITALVSKIVQNTRYLNLTVTNELAEIYQTWGTEMISWEVPNTLSKFDDFKTSPALFSQYGLGSSFLKNFWPTFMTIMVGLGVLCVSFVLRMLLEKGQYRGRFYAVMQRLVAGSFNFVIVQVYGCLDDILFDLVLDTKTNPFNSFFSWASVLCAVGFLAIGCSLVFMNMRVVYKYQAIKAEGLATKDTSGMEAFNQRNQYWELFYSEFNDEDFWSQSALALFIIRGTLSSLTVTVFYDYPMMQTSFLVILDGVVVMFLIFKKPFTALRGKLAQYYFETITLLVHLCTFILAFQDTVPTSSDTLRSILCTGILYLNTILVAGGIGFMAIEIYDIIRLKAETHKYKHPQEIAANHLAVDENSSTIQNQTIITVTNDEIEMQRKPNLTKRQPAGTLETSNLFSESNNTFFSGLLIKPAQTLDLSMNADDSNVLQDVETGSGMNQQHRGHRDRSPKAIRPRNRTTTKKQQQQQMLDGLFLRNPTRHLRDLKNPMN